MILGLHYRTVDLASGEVVVDGARVVRLTTTEREILAALRQSRERRPVTEVLVSHRLSVVADCDLLLVLDQGRIIERGSHGDLLSIA